MVDDNSGTLTKYLNGEGIDNKLRVQTGSDVKYFLTDHLGSTNGLADTSGNLTASNSYDSFGNSTNANFPTRYQFTGREYDHFNGLHYYRARFYDANLGRFISEDPIGFRGGDINLYGYVKNNPQNFRDPKGTHPLVLLAGFIAFEVAIHAQFADAAQRAGLGPDKQKHCFVNCMSVRFHLGSPLAATGISLAQEAGNIGISALRDTWSGFGFTLRDSAGDMMANFYGQAASYVFWRNCRELCSECSIR